MTELTQMTQKAEQELEKLVQEHNGLANGIAQANERLQQLRGQIIAAQASVATLKAAAGVEHQEGALPPGFAGVFKADETKPAPSKPSDAPRESSTPKKERKLKIVPPQAS